MRQQCIIGDLIVITVMYFDPYSKGRNPPNAPSNSSIPTTQTNSKFTILRPPPQNYPLPKPPYADLRSDNNKHNTSAHVFLSAAKPSTIPQRVTSNYPVRQQPSFPLPFSRHTLPEQQKYICHSPGKNGSRISAGMVFEEIPQNRYDYRRSESITEMKPLGEAFRDSSVNYYQPHQRLSNDPIDPRSAPSPPMQLKFNPQLDRNRILRKESAEGPQMTNRQERPQPPSVRQPYSQKKILKQGSSDLFQNRPAIPSFDPQKYEYLTARAEPTDTLKKYDFQTRRFEPAEVKRVEPYRTFDEIYKNSLQSVFDKSDLRRESSQDLLKKYSVSKFPDLDKSLDKDIETLRLTNKKSDQIIDRQMHKNAYLNQLFEPKGEKPTPAPTDEKMMENNIKEKKEVAARNMVFERQLEEKKLELLQKGKLLGDRERELQERNREILLKDGEIAQRDKLLKQKEKEVGQRDKQLLEKDTLLQEKMKEMRKSLAERDSLIADKDGRILQGENMRIDKERVICNLNAEISRLQEDLLRRQDRWKQLEASLAGQLSSIRQDLSITMAKNKELQAKLSQKQDSILKISQEHKMQVKIIQNQLSQAAQTITHQQSTISAMQSTILNQEAKINQQNSALEILKQKCESDKMSLIHLYKKEVAELQAKFQANNKEKPEHEVNAYLEAEIAQLKQRNSLIDEDLSTLKKQLKITSQNQQILQEQYSEIISLLLLPKQSPHQKVIARLRECLQSFGRSQGLQAKELQRIQDYQAQRIQQEHLQRRHQQLSRELKKVGSRLVGANIQAQQGTRLLREANQQILVMNLMNLNEKYRFLLENQ